MDKQETVINQELLIWCVVVVVELFVLAFLIQSVLVLLIGLVLIPPVKAAFNWPVEEEAIENDTEEIAEAE